MPKHRSDTGFTLLELIMVMLIVAILAAVGIPSFKYVTNSNRMSAEVNSLLGDMQYARTEAVKQGLAVTVCPSTNPLATPPSCTGAGPSHWESGWIIFVDVNSSGTVQTGDTILRTQNAFTGTDTFIANNNAVKAVIFNRMGYGTTGATTSVNLALHSVPTNSAWTRCLAISTVGMLTTLKNGVGGCT